MTAEDFVARKPSTRERQVVSCIVDADEEVRRNGVYVLTETDTERGTRWEDLYTLSPTAQVNTDTIPVHLVS